MIKAILTDIEGTTSSISFVKDVLFPYAYQEMENFLVQHFNNDFVYEQAKMVCELEGLKDGCQPRQIAEILREWIKCDRKLTPLKELQGMIWEKGYKNGDYQAHIYEDAYEKLTQWHQENIPIYIYSSGSVYAQKLFFGYSNYGNLLNLFSGFFDTNVGYKQEVDSYNLIAEKMEFKPEEILFLSDIEDEIISADKAGMKTIWVIRDEQQLPENKPYKIVRNFHEINF
ncbi:acireductone synthase [Cyanobacterium sp. IPPAS B-1200]|uniref:acireductone synthase n=1 Tax=Cyanobacterium sp. IPPAS B-1200 TaxID=1562720 RepID=UPI0008527077|nr:acireductone synthase [Cyanobacterium sp. IPPAS B-1200]OEJ77473.1 2,3-diketo-5-methylthio-1-phosphopentane phosphatase [Cyanobacterium sp. IPPAS B-1200]